MSQAKCQYNHTDETFCIKYPSFIRQASLWNLPTTDLISHIYIREITDKCHEFYSNITHHNFPTHPAIKYKKNTTEFNFEMQLPRQVTAYPASLRNINVWRCSLTFMNEHWQSSCVSEATILPRSLMLLYVYTVQRPCCGHDTDL